MKRLFDLLVGVIMLLFASPIIVLIAILIRLKLGSPVFFRQPRPGLNGSIFYMNKFRTMSNKLDANGMLLSDKDRLTTFGKFMRSASLDEFPSLWSVISGDMSIVGPRPLLIEYLTLYSAKHSRRHEMKPGITGWAQVNGRNSISWNEKFELDVWYVDNHSIWLDTKILFLTVKKVILRNGISQDDHVSMEKFKGYIDADK
jgi:sugar transferase EpsL